MESKMENRMEKIEKELKELKLENKAMNERLENQARLVISLGKKVMKLDAMVRENSPFKTLA